MSEHSVLVTGATSGIGLAIARRLAAEHTIVLATRDATKAAEIMAGLPHPTRHRVWTHDLIDLDGVEGSLNAFLTETGLFLSDFVHAAGSFEIHAARSVEIDVVKRLFTVNVFSAVEIIRHLVRQRINKDRLRSIVLIGSISSRIGAKGFSAYAATKGALTALVRSLAVELAPRVRVNCVSPGGIETPGTRALFAEPSVREAMAQWYPLGEGAPEDIAAMVRFLISEEARWITGQELMVDGGRSLL